MSVLHAQTSSGNALVSACPILPAPGGALAGGAPRGSVVSRHDKRVEAARRHGSCLQLWKRSALRDELWRARRPAPPAPIHPRPPAAVTERSIAAEPKRYADPSPPRPVDPLAEAYIQLVTSNLLPERLCFFSGSYSNEYGYPHGLMLARNVQADFRRALEAFGFGDRGFTCSVEQHPSGRDVLHLHALVEELTRQEMAELEQLWTESRGWSKAVPCHDGGVRYVCKYALKGSNVDTFEWRFLRSHGASEGL